LLGEEAALLYDPLQEGIFMSSQSRRYLFISLIGLLAATWGCGPKFDPSNPESVAKQFVEIYYVQKDAASALPLTNSIAAYKIKNKVQVPPGSQAGGSASAKTEYQLVTTTPRGPDQTIYVYALQFHSPAFPDRKVFVNTQKKDGKWQVFQYIEQLPSQELKPPGTPPPETAPTSPAPN